MQITNVRLQQALKNPYVKAGQLVCNKLQQNGFEAVWVGGAVRDLLLGNDPKDIDIATSATPEQIAVLFPKHAHVHKTIGACLVTEQNCMFEITTFREESKEHSQRTPHSVVYTTMKIDANRRDFTINSLYFDPVTIKLHDFTNGLQDLQEKLVVFIGNPNTRIKQDPLRMLRAVRLKVLIQGQYHPATFKALQSNAKLCSTLSGFRIGQELEKLLALPNATEGLEDVWETKILEQTIPELYACKGVPQPSKYHKEGDVWEHSKLCLQKCTISMSIDVRLAIVFHDIGKTTTFSIDHERIHFNDHASTSGEITKNILQRLQFSKIRTEKIVWLVKHHMMLHTLLELSEKRKAHWFFHQWFPELLQIFYLDIAGTIPADFTMFEKVFEEYTTFITTHPKPPTPLVDGKDVMTILNLREGKIIGEILETVYDMQLQKKLTTKKAAIEYIQKHKDDYTRNTNTRG